MDAPQFTHCLNEQEIKLFFILHPNNNEYPSIPSRSTVYPPWDTFPRLGMGESGDGLELDAPRSAANRGAALAGSTNGGEARRTTFEYPKLISS